MDKARQEKLILFMRYPEPGTTKTRLIPRLGPEGAARAHREMAEHMVRRVRGLLAVRPVDFEIRFEGGGEDAMAAWFGPRFRYVRQGPGDIGERMRCAFDAAFTSDADRVIIIGADCPALTSSHLALAFEHLIEYDLALGPALDGGYYLIGLNRSVPELFGGMAWGSAQVLLQTKKRAAGIGLKIVELEPLADVDRPEDLEHFHYHTGS